MLVERPLWPLYAEGLLWARNVRQKPPWTLCALWEKNLPSELFVCYLIARVRSLSHRWTQENRVVRVYRKFWPLTPPSPPHALPDCRRALTTIQNTPFLHAEHALLAPRRACSWRVLITFCFLVGYRLDSSRCRPLVLRTKIYVLCNAQQEVSKWLSLLRTTDKIIRCNTP